jgi:hypothetical protein
VPQKRTREEQNGGSNGTGIAGGVYVDPSASATADFHASRSTSGTAMLHSSLTVDRREEQEPHHQSMLHVVGVVHHFVETAEVVGVQDARPAASLLRWSQVVVGSVSEPQLRLPLPLICQPAGSKPTGPLPKFPQEMRHHYEAVASFPACLIASEP